MKNLLTLVVVEREKREKNLGCEKKTTTSKRPGKKSKPPVVDDIDDETYPTIKKEIEKKNFGTYFIIIVSMWRILADLIHIPDIN